MKAIVIGLGSMGKRRVRNLIENGITDITGFDIRLDRQVEAVNKYNIKIIDKIDIQALAAFDSVIISTPPDLHMKYAQLAFAARKNMFIEASVVDSPVIANLNKENQNLTKPLVIAPSCTMKYFEGPKLIKKLIKENAIGKTLYFNYCVGQYLPDWHPWESISDFYVSQRATGGCREIVPFEMTWLSDIWGMPSASGSVYTKLSNMSVDIDDIYTAHLKFNDNVLGILTVEVLSRPIATREMRVVGEKGLIHFSGDQSKIFLKTLEEEKVFDLNKGSVEKNYINPEEPYISEIKDFLRACVESNPSIFPNNLEMDVQTLQVLNDIERVG